MIPTIFLKRCGERVGICGRSGSGKSSLALALVRVVECFRGSILVDGQDITTLPLALLRSGVTVISQDAHLFSGSVRETIDPVGQVGGMSIFFRFMKGGWKGGGGSLALWGRLVFLVRFFFGTIWYNARDRLHDRFWLCCGEVAYRKF